MLYLVELNIFKRGMLLYQVNKHNNRHANQTGEQKEKTEWHRVVMFNRLAEIAKDYLLKGSKVYLEGKLQTRKWQDQTGQDRYTTEIVVNQLQMLDSAPSAPANNYEHDTMAAAPQQVRQPPQARSPAQQTQQVRQPAQARSTQRTTPVQPAPQPAYAMQEDFDDDVPF